MWSRMVFSNTARGWGYLGPYSCSSPAPQSSPVFPGGHRHCPVTRWQGAPTQEQEPEQFTPNLPTGHSVGRAGGLSLSMCSCQSWELSLWPQGDQYSHRERNLVGIGGCERSVWAIVRKRQGQGSWRTRQPVLQELWSSRTLESSQEHRPIPAPADAPRRTPPKPTKECNPVPSPPHLAPQPHSCSHLLAG